MRPDEIWSLREKYREMLRLRELDAAGVRLDSKSEMAKLAQRFPGILREIDDLPLPDIERRIASLERAWADPTHVEPWMVATHMFHSLTRGALAAKKWLAGKRGVTKTVVDAFQRDALTFECAEEALAWTEELDRVASPPRGRVTELVFERMGDALGIGSADAKRLVFGLSRKEKARLSRRPTAPPPNYDGPNGEPTTTLVSRRITTRPKG